MHEVPRPTNAEGFLHGELEANQSRETSAHTQANPVMAKILAERQTNGAGKEKGKQTALGGFIFGNTPTWPLSYLIPKTQTAELPSPTSPARQMLDSKG